MPNKEEKIDERFKKPAIELQKELEEKWAKKNEATDINTKEELKRKMRPVREKGTAEWLRKELEKPESKANLYVRLVKHLVMVGQIPDPNMTDDELIADYLKGEGK